MNGHDILERIFQWIDGSPIRAFAVLWLGGFTVRMLVWLALGAGTPAEAALMQYAFTSFVWALLLAVFYGLSTMFG
jgi:hypothetical protein